MSINNDPRFDAMQDWLTDELQLTCDSIAPASSDASFRRYFRVTTSDVSYVVMDAPPEKEDCRPFIRVATAMLDMKLNVPEILEQDLQQGFLLLSDLGATQYLHQLSENSVEQLYGDATNALVKLQLGGDVGTDLLPAYDNTLLMNEMALFSDWLLDRHLGVVLSDREQAALLNDYTTLANNALEQPRVWVHRDFHSRNLMVTGANNPGILDFQDAVIGAVSYDLVSLLKDCYIAWPQERVETWVRDYYNRVRAEGLLAGASFNELLHWFELMGIQRHLKASGIFARLNYRDHKPGYLKDVSRTLSYILRAKNALDQLPALAGVLHAHVAPHMETIAQPRIEH